MYTFREIQKACKQIIEGREVRLAVLGNCATQFFSAAVEGYGKLSGLNMNVFDADYNQIEEQLVDPSSEVYHFKPDCILLWFGTEKLYEEFLAMEPGKRSGFAVLYLHKIQFCWDLICQHSEARILQFNFSEIDDRVLGNYSCRVESTFVYQIRKLNYLLEESMVNRGNVYPVDLLSIQTRLGEKIFHNAPLYYSARMNVSMDALPFVAEAVADILLAMEGRIKKCIVLDLDNTLWGGVIGDDGLGGIEIGELGRGHVFTSFQRWLKQLKEYGILLAVCSKNEEDTAREPFEKHREMVLRLSDIALFVSNWDDKATNIRMIQETLNIGMDSMVFLDDNPFERDLVRTRIPEIEVPELPEDPALWLSFLQKCNYFETVSCVTGSGDRTEQYQAEFGRRKLEQTFHSLDDYLESLEMVGKAELFVPRNFSRIAQLTQRSNQFNLRTVRYSEDEIRRIAGDERYLAFSCTLKDRFGDHGLVAAVIMEKRSREELFIDTWLMSCRVLKRTMEEYVINCMLRTAGENGFQRISAEYIPTPKNRMVKDLYRSMGFTETEENHYTAAVRDLENRKTFIREEMQ